MADSASDGRREVVVERRWRYRKEVVTEAKDSIGGGASTVVPTSKGQIRIEVVREIHCR
jgi:hypothetical protein